MHICVRYFSVCVCVSVLFVQYERCCGAKGHGVVYVVYE